MLLIGHVSEKSSTQVTWIENMEIEEKAPIHLLFRDLVGSGAAFGAHRWLTTLQRTCERFACLMAAGASPRDIGGGDFATKFYASSRSKARELSIYCEFAGNFFFSYSVAGREKKHDEAFAENGEQLLRESERVSHAPMDDAVGSERRGRSSHGPQKLGSGPAQRRSSQRGDLAVAARFVRARLQLFPRRDDENAGGPSYSA